MSERLAGEVIGFRQWKIGPELELQSGNAVHAWERGVNTAKCVGAPIYGQHEAPAPGCGCGLYAMHSPGSFWYGANSARMPMQVMVLIGSPAPAEYVAGLVSAWGRVEVHHDGFRAEHARVAAIAVPDPLRPFGCVRHLVAPRSAPVEAALIAAWMALRASSTKRVTSVCP